MLIWCFLFSWHIFWTFRKMERVVGLSELSWDKIYSRILFRVSCVPLLVGRKNFFSLFRQERPLHITVILLKLHLYSSLESTDVILERISEMLSIGQIFISGETVSESTPEKCCRCPDLIKHQMIKINSLKSGQILWLIYPLQIRWWWKFDAWIPFHLQLLKIKTFRLFSMLFQFNWPNNSPFRISIWTYDDFGG